jgi:hypothetical protein
MSKHSELKNVLMRRDEMTEDEADELIAIMRRRCIDGEDPEDLLYELGLEPDYIFDIIP